MMIAGVEEPLKASDMLYALDEVGEKKVLDVYENDKLNRYCFVWLGAFDDASINFAKLISSLKQPFDTSATWLSVWSVPEGFDEWVKAWRWVITPSKAEQQIAKGRKIWQEDKRVREELIKSRQQDGWTICKRNNLVIALKVVDLDTMTDFMPSGYKYTDKGGIALIIGSNISCEVFLQTAPQCTLAWMGQKRSLYHTTGFLNWLVENQLTILYIESDDAGRPGLIIVTPHRLPTKHLLRQGIVPDILVGTEAERVWRYHVSKM